MRRVFRLPSTRTRLVREIDDELAFHIETRVRQLIDGGMSADDARREAQRQFGDVESVRRSCVAVDEQRERTVRRMSFSSDIAQDVGFALRTLRRNAGFTALVVGALAIGIGANTAIFTMIDAVLVRGLPVPHPEQLVAIGDPTRVSSYSTGGPRTDLLSAPLYHDVRDQNHLFSGVFASGRPERLDVRVDDQSSEIEHPHGRFVSGNYFDVLGVRALAGRTFDASADSLVDGLAAVTISYGYWVRRFHGDRSVVGRTIIADGVKCAIVGITPPEFTGEIVEQRPDIWIPLGVHDAMRPHPRILDDRSTSWLLAMGRLRPGATLAEARREIGPLINRDIVANSPPLVVSDFLQGHPKEFVSSGAKGFSRVRTTFEAPLFTLMIGVALLLCIICANVANLLLARAIARGREMAVRLAMGADRARLVRQLLTESAVLAIASAGAGLAVAQASGHWLVILATGSSTLTSDAALSSSVLAFTLGVSVAAVAIFGLVPALYASRVDLASVMRATSASVTGAAGGGRRPLGKLLIIGQVSLSVVLLAGAAILSRSLRNVRDADVGLDRDHLAIAEVDILSSGLSGAPLFIVAHTVRDRLAALPGVSAVGFSENGIFSGTDSHTTIELTGFPVRTPDDTMIAYDNVSTGYARAIGARLIEGRDI
ncbi:MAG TPA: ABC transporter permease, partial [Gemmatimonadaceae bacterium]|nr:ABC transporter permease [Gemmatimonadaceae bacterium]